jgi:hypothetical protein
LSVRIQAILAKARSSSDLKCVRLCSTLRRGAEGTLAHSSVYPPDGSRNFVSLECCSLGTAQCIREGMELTSIAYVETEWKCWTPNGWLPHVAAVCHGVCQRRPLPAKGLLESPWMMHWIVFFQYLPVDYSFVFDRYSWWASAVGSHGWFETFVRRRYRRYSENLIVGRGLYPTVQTCWIRVGFVCDCERFARAAFHRRTSSCLCRLAGRACLKQCTSLGGFRIRRSAFEHEGLPWIVSGYSNLSLIPAPCTSW